MRKMFIIVSRDTSGKFSQVSDGSEVLVSILLIKVRVRTRRYRGLSS